MKICVVGAGAIGGMLGIKLALAGEDVTLIARGPHLEAMKKNGLKVIWNDGTESVATNCHCTSNMREAGVQDVIILGLKEHQIEAAIDDIHSMVGPNTFFVTTQNGIPWWFFQRYSGPPQYNGSIIKAVDPNGRLFHGFDPERIVGCVVYPASFVSEPGVIKHIEGNRFPLGELDGASTERITKLSEALTRAGFKSPILDDIRSEMWLKLWGSVAFNPISALTHATLVDLCTFPETKALSIAMMTEAQEIARRVGSEMRVPLEKRLNGAAAVGKHKTSMLQDVEAGRPMEISALIGAVVELAALTQTQAPHISAVHACITLLGHVMHEQRVAFPPKPL